MRLTAFSDVSLRIMMLLSALDPDQKLSTQKIADGVGTPYNHVAKSVAFLVNQGLLQSTRGRAGGVLLSAKGRQATVGQVLRTTEGDIPMIECEDQDGNCPLDSFCRLRNVLADAREAFYAAVDDVVISDLPAPPGLPGLYLWSLGWGRWLRVLTAKFSKPLIVSVAARFCRPVSTEPPVMA